MSKHLLHVALYAVILLLTASVIRSYDALPYWGMARGKLAFLEHHLEDYDVLFLGSSRVHNGFMPSVFDERMTELGEPVKSFCWGQSGQRQHDYDPIIDWLIGQRPQRLKYLMIELHAWVQGPRNNNWMSAHEIGRHQWQTFRTRAVSLLIGRDDFGTKCEKLLHCGAHVLANTFRIGQGPRILDENLAPLDGRKRWKRWRIPHEGWKELSQETARKRRLKVHEEWRSRPDRAAGQLAKKRENIAIPRFNGGFNHGGMERQIERLRAAGIEPIYVIMPHYATNFLGRDGALEWADKVTILELDRPQLAGPIYDFSNWFDSAHMIKSGAQLCSKKIAEFVHEAGKKAIFDSK